MKTKKRDGKKLVSCPEVIKDPTRLVRRSGFSIFGTPQHVVTWHNITIEGESVVSKNEERNPWRQDTQKVLGRLVKVINTIEIRDDEKAVSVVQAELERLRGEMKDPSLEAVQLTSIMAAYSRAFAIYKPQ